MLLNVLASDLQSGGQRPCFADHINILLVFIRIQINWFAMQVLEHLVGGETCILRLLSLGSLVSELVG